MATIRPAVEADVPSILELYDQLAVGASDGKSHLKPALEDCAQVFAQIDAMPGHELLVAEEDGRVIGTTVLIIVPNLTHGALPWAIIENMVVDEPLQRRGVGRQMMEYAINRARQAGCYKIQLLSSNFRSEAHRFYQSVGFAASAHGFRMYL
jgi:GNAT superfamily N-acetyltransferase